MASIRAKCIQCGTIIEVDDVHEIGICRYCGGKILIDEKAIEYNQSLVTNNENEGAPSDEQRPSLDGAKYIYQFRISDDQATVIDDLLGQGDKIKAIKAVREITGIGLAGAKAFIDNHSIGEWSSAEPKMPPSSNSAPPQSSGCYVATCVYGSYDCPEVWTLRRFRDYTLDKTLYGRLFIKCYYAISPSIVKWFGNTEWFKAFWKKRLDAMVANLRAQGVEDTEYTDKY